MPADGRRSVRCSNRLVGVFRSSRLFPGLYRKRRPSAGADEGRGLAGLLREQMAADPFSCTVYVFRAKRADRIKLMYWDGTGLCLFAKRLEDGEFRWPKTRTG